MLVPPANVEKSYSSVLGVAWFFSDDGKFPLRWVKSVPSASTDGLRRSAELFLDPAAYADGTDLIMDRPASYAAVFLWHAVHFFEVGAVVSALTLATAS
jgi:hypothetical protein